MPDIMPPEMMEQRSATGCDVTVLLATYNGAAFLRSQLASLREQVGVNWRMLWRDDGSVDGSVAVMEAFSATAGGRLSRICDPAARLGVTRSYYSLVQRAPRGNPIAFCDQDDVWLPEKLARGFAALAGVAPDLPALYCARQRLVDAQLRPLGVSVPLGAPPEFPMALTQNIATGCTVMLNAAAAELLRAAPPPPGTLHDWWSYLLVSAAGGRLLMDDEPVVLYRQHGHNLVGAPHTAWRRAIAAVRRGPAIFMAVFREHLAALGEHPELLLPESSRAVREIEAALRSGLAARLLVLWRYRLRRQTRLETALFVVWFLIG
jgi:hypothetical protein